MLNAILPAAVPAEVSEHYKGRLASWRSHHAAPGRTEPLAHFLHTLRLVRALLARLHAQDIRPKLLLPLQELTLTLRLKCFDRVVAAILKGSQLPSFLFCHRVDLGHRC